MSGVVNAGMGVVGAVGAFAGAAPVATERGCRAAVTSTDAPADIR
jgi:hypothetical protein